MDFREYYERSAESGVLFSQLNMGFFLLSYNRLEYDIEAVKWFKRAEEQSNLGKYVLGYLYYNGDGVKQSYIEAIKRFSIVAKERGDAAMMLALMYINGKGLPQNYQRADVMFSICKNSDSLQEYIDNDFPYYHDSHSIESMLYNFNYYDLVVNNFVNYGYRDFIDESCWKEEEKPFLADACFFPCCGNYLEAQLNLGLLYFEGKSVAQDYKIAFKLLMKAFDGCNYEDKTEINGIVCYLLSLLEKSSEYNPFAASSINSEYVELIIKQNNPVLSFIVGLMYYHGLGVSCDFDQAVKWFTFVSEYDYENNLDLINRLIGIKAKAILNILISEGGYIDKDAVLDCPYNEEPDDLTDESCTPPDTPDFPFQ